jgi:hypothetical protein
MPRRQPTGEKARRQHGAPGGDGIAEPRGGLSAGIEVLERGGEVRVGGQRRRLLLPKVEVASRQFLKIELIRHAGAL